MECNKANQNTCLPAQITQWRVCTAGWAHLCMTAPTFVLQGFSWLTQARIQSWRNVRVVAGVNNTNIVFHSRRAWLRLAYFMPFAGARADCRATATMCRRCSNSFVRVLSLSDFERTQREALTCTGAVCTWLWDHQRGGKEHSIFWGQRLGDIPSLVGGAKNP